MNEMVRGEAVTRLMILKLPSGVLDEYRNGEVMLSKQTVVGGIPFSQVAYLDNALKNEVNAYETKTGNTVYHVIETDDGYGFLFLNEDPDKWLTERNLCIQKKPILYLSGNNQSTKVEKCLVGLKVA